MPQNVNTQARECFCPACGYKFYLTTHLVAQHNAMHRYYMVHRWDTTETVSTCPDCEAFVNVGTVTTKRERGPMDEDRTQCLCGTCDTVLWVSCDYYDNHIHYWFYKDNTSQVELKRCPECSTQLQAAYVSFDIPNTTAVIPRELLPALSTED